VALKPKPKLLHLLPWEDEPSAANRAHKRIGELEHELRVLQNSNRETIKHAEKLAENRGFNQAQRKLSFQMQEKDAEIERLKRALKATGHEWVCPECGCFIHPDNVIRRELDS
jgi:rubrerythrin